MSVVSWRKDGTAVIGKNTDIPLSKGTGNKAQGRITAPAMQNTPSLTSGRKEKILAVRQQLTEGRYDLDERLNIALDRMLESLIA